MDDRLAREALADVLGALAHPDRLHIVTCLAAGPCDVASLSEAVGCSQPRTSQHLALLRSHHLVQSERDGRRHIYALVDGGLPAWLAAGMGLLGQPGRDGAALAAAVRALRERLERPA